MNSERPSSNPRGISAFTLVEIMVVLVIIGLLAALAIPAIQRTQRASKTARVANDLRVFSQAFEIYNTQNGGWPDTAAPGVMPSLPVSIADTLRVASWQSDTAVGGHWQWQNNSTTAGDTGICISGFTCTDMQLQELDAKTDDGNLATGKLKKTSPTLLFYVLATGP